MGMIVNKCKKIGGGGTLSTPDACFKDLRAFKFKYFGFTLAEMMVVMLILSIVMAAMAPVMTTRNKLDQSSPWQWSTNGSDAYFGIGDAQVAMIGQQEANNNDSGARLVINAGDGKDHILFKTDDTVLGRLKFENNGLLLGSLLSGNLGSNASAFGLNTRASNNNTTAVGVNASATGTDSTSLGSSSVASGTQSSAIGYSAQASGNYSHAIGDEASAGAEGTIAIGSQSSSTIASGISIGMQSSSTNTDTIAIGKSSVASGYQSTVLGSGSTGSGLDSTAIGNTSKATNSFASALGYASEASGSYSTALGTNAKATGSYSTALGYNSNSTATTSTAIGFASEAAGNSSIALGNSASANLGSTALGSYSEATDNYSTAVGYHSVASASYTTALGYNSEASEANSIAIGSGAEASGSYALALGYNANAAGTNNIAIGLNACTYATGSNKVCIGNNSGPRSGTIATDSTERIFIGGRSHFNGGASVLEVFNSTNMLKVDNNNFSLTETGVVINGNLIVKGVTITRGAYAGGHGGENFAGYDDRTVAIGSSGDSALKKGNVPNTEMFQFFNGDGAFSNGDSTYFSDRRLKYVGKENTSGLDKIRELKVFNYTFKKDNKKTPHVGVIAQDLQKVFPDAVKKGVDGFLTIRMEDMFFAMINAIKELDAKYQAQEKRINELEARIEKLEAKIK